MRFLEVIFLLLVIEVWTLVYLCKVVYFSKKFLCIFASSHRKWDMERELVFYGVYCKLNFKQVSVYNLDPALKRSRENLYDFSNK